MPVQVVFSRPYTLLSLDSSPILNQTSRHCPIARHRGTRKQKDFQDLMVHRRRQAAFNSARQQGPGPASVIAYGQQLPDSTAVRPLADADNVIGIPGDEVHDSKGAIHHASMATGLYSPKPNASGESIRSQETTQDKTGLALDWAPLDPRLEALEAANRKSPCLALPLELRLKVYDMLYLDLHLHVRVCNSPNGPFFVYYQCCEFYTAGNVYNFTREGSFEGRPDVYADRRLHIKWTEQHEECLAKEFRAENRFFFALCAVNYGPRPAKIGPILIRFGPRPRPGSSAAHNPRAFENFIKLGPTLMGISGFGRPKTCRSPDPTPMGRSSPEKPSRSTIFHDSGIHAHVLCWTDHCAAFGTPEPKSTARAEHTTNRARKLNAYTILTITMKILAASVPIGIASRDRTGDEEQLQPLLDQAADILTKFGPDQCDDDGGDDSAHKRWRHGVRQKIGEKVESCEEAKRQRSSARQNGSQTEGEGNDGEGPHNWYKKTLSL
ncbi:hypothetical protein K491DRAFT_685497 [Lophiostoma macrostomum CBS 122681]|uniref:Uncharacterized protein n=1 Tax=Lophiostoma macrostomum CBS 122681 TaxID=1314788 RepID=A0A6A6SMR9_9PLEO|nr:hypothetical protein K491DRAFT_685497 [Lophiostoma macrostomum CBS 122681]